MSKQDTAEYLQQLRTDAEWVAKRDAGRAKMGEQDKATPRFTPGPWRAELHGQNVLACDDQMMICNVRGWGYLTGEGALNLPEDEAIAIQDANTHLIAAAPAMYNALKFKMNSNHLRGCKCDNCKAANAALALAEGKQS